ncbi:MAG: aspartate-semialdehyde dehydrogenase [Armatimonadetes bacterium]|nr:aspartate-semialdehyde dehydrogenase [Armatimonadota bacterium]
MGTHTVAVVGATGVVGRTVVRILEERRFPVKRLRLSATARSAGKTVPFCGDLVKVEETTADVLRGADFAFFAAGKEASTRFAWEAAASGTVVIDKSSAFRMDPRVPLVIPEINGHALAQHQGVISTPNCSTIVMLMALWPLHRAARVRRAVVATYQSVSGAGDAAVDALRRETDALAGRADLLEGGATTEAVEVVSGTAKPIAFNVLFQWKFEEDGATDEEQKMIAETEKIAGEPIAIAPTTVRVPVVVGHGMSISAEFEHDLSPEEAREVLARFPGVEVWDDPKKDHYPTPLLTAGRDPVYVGRIRRDPTVACGLHLWAVGDNLRKGAALNAVQIAEALIGSAGTAPRPAGVVESKVSW